MRLTAALENVVALGATRKLTGREVAPAGLAALLREGDTCGRLRAELAEARAQNAQLVAAAEEERAAARRAAEAAALDALHQRAAEAERRALQAEGRLAAVDAERRCKEADAAHYKLALARVMQGEVVDLECVRVRSTA